MSVEIENIKGVFADLDDGGITEDEAITQIRKLVGATVPLPKLVVLTGSLPFTVTVDTETNEVTEFEVNYDFPNWDRKEGPELRKSGEKLDLSLYSEEQIEDLYAVVDGSTGDWPDPERM